MCADGSCKAFNDWPVYLANGGQGTVPIQHVPKQLLIWKNS